MGQRLTTMTSGQKRFPIAPSIFKFAQHGECGMWVSELLPHTAKMVDDIAIINHGEVIVKDTTANLLGRMDSKTLVITPSADSALPALPDSVTGQKLADGTLTFTYQSVVTPADQILSLVRDAGITIKDVRTQEPDLEDVFLSLTAGG